MRTESATPSLCPPPAADPAVAAWMAARVPDDAVLDQALSALQLAAGAQHGDFRAFQLVFARALIDRVFAAIENAPAKLGDDQPSGRIPQ